MGLVGPLTVTDVDAAPTAPGLYVWYAKLIIGEADLASPHSLTSLLQGFSSRFERQPMRIRARLNFNLAWEGEIGTTSARPASDLMPSDAGAACSLVAELLRSSQHLFFQPLYIGKAEVSLRQRLRQHVDEFLRLKDVAQENDRELKVTDDFAQRAASLRFSEDHLVCYALPLSSTVTLSATAAGRVLSLVELYLNSWAAPILGRK